MLSSLNYRIILSFVSCDLLRLTPPQGRGKGKLLTQCPIRPTDYMLADRGYSTAIGIRKMAAINGYVSVCVKTASLALKNQRGSSATG